MSSSEKKLSSWFEYFSAKPTQNNLELLLTYKRALQFQTVMRKFAITELTTSK